ncbi:hypothetical protein [Sphingopyxis yananensis]|nr:hypothetical protein [Sphingopyxis yananensis]
MRQPISNTARTSTLVELASALAIGLTLGAALGITFMGCIQ